MSLNFKTIEAKFSKVRSNTAFEMFVIGVIIFSALVVGVKTYDISPNIAQAIRILDWFITTIFIVELVVRFLGDQDKKRFFTHAWNIFDTLIVLISIVPIEDSEMAFIGRLIRIFRVLRMISIIPELRILLTSLLKALPQLGYVMLLMFIIFYIYAAVGSTLFAKINPTLWGDIAISLLTLFRVMTFEDWTDVMYETQAVYPLSWIFYLTFIFFTAFAFLNMVIGIVVNVMEKEQQAALAEEHKAEAENEQEKMRQLRADIAEIKAILLAKNQDPKT
ncbi:MAG: ion transporter [Alteromonadaceae bacterium]|nr:MAG: ion transporter [Alteromonadaceae bacterium]